MLEAAACAILTKDQRDEARTVVDMPSKGLELVTNARDRSAQVTPVADVQWMQAEEQT